MVAGRMLDGWLPKSLDAATRNAIQDVLWAGQGALEIPRRTRRAIARALDLDDVTVMPDRFIALLERLWVLGDDPLAFFADIVFADSVSSLRKQIRQHVLGNPDWSAERLFDELGAIDSADDARFVRFLEGLASPSVVPARTRSGASPPPSIPTCAPPAPNCGKPDKTAAAGFA